MSQLTCQSINGAKQKSRRCSAKESSILSERSDGAFQKKRRCFLKESTMLRGSSQYTLRYHLTAMPWEVVIRDKTECNHCLFHLGFVKLSLCCLPISVDTSGATQWSWEDSEKILVFFR